MVLFRTSQIIVLAALLTATPAFATRTHRAATSGHSHHRSRHHHFVPGQRQIEPERATEIQNALIREHYLPGPASGQWDATTEAAMQKYQADHGWQTKLTPDSRALIKLGLGPHDDTALPTPSAPAPPLPATADDAGHAPAAGTLAATNTIQN
jgi:Putative peptidoglycan binding domain